MNWMDKTAICIIFLITILISIAISEPLKRDIREVKKRVIALERVGMFTTGTLTPLTIKIPDVMAGEFVGPTQTVISQSADSVEELVLPCHKLNGGQHEMVKGSI